MKDRTEIDLTALPVPVQHGPGILAELGGTVSATGGKRVLVVTDPGIVRAGHVERAVGILEGAGVEVSVFDKVHENPTSDDVAACVEAAREHETDVLVGLGGGSSMDAAKGCNFLLTNGGTMKDYWGVDKATKPMLPFIAVPTTAGTGSECQRFALISDPVTHQKMACGDPKAAARVALLDPELTLTQSAFITACTGLDAMTHAVESAVTRVATDRSVSLAHEAFRLIMESFERVLDAPDNLEARSGMQLAATLAGSAIELSMLGAAHAAANPLTAHYDVVHGQAVANTIGPVLRFNRNHPSTEQGYAQLGEHAGLDSVDALAGAIDGFLEKTGLRLHLNEKNLTDDDLNMLSAEASKQWTAGFNPQPIHEEEFKNIYQSIL